MSQLFLILFLVGLVLTQIVDYVGIHYLDTAGFIVMGVAAISYFIALIVKAVRKRSAASDQ